ncbi:MAG: hypothetical protein LBT62_00475 [Deltaproteobacteria bacterium]|jgi:hypothetical protein|nr:hypothetical protein [Deltaproteobacteria bacterium]
MGDLSTGVLFMGGLSTGVLSTGVLSTGDLLMGDLLMGDLSIADLSTGALLMCVVQCRLKGDHSKAPLNGEMGKKTCASKTRSCLAPGRCGFVVCESMRLRIIG